MVTAPLLMKKCTGAVAGEVAPIWDARPCVKVESKKDLAKREVASPNLADAFVMCFAPACFASHVTVTERAVMAKPEDMGFAEAATIPTAYFTVYYALKYSLTIAVVGLIVASAFR